jgi:hypothetical protein
MTTRRRTRERTEPGPRRVHPVNAGAAPNAGLTKRLTGLLVLTGLGLGLVGCATSDVNPAQARAQTGYVDLYAGSPGQFSWEVSRFDERAQDFEHVFSDFDPPQKGIVRVALSPGPYRLKVAILNRLTTGPVKFQVRVEDGKITPVQFTLKRAGSGEVETAETNVGDTLYGRYGRNTRFSDVQDAEYAVSAAVETAVAYHVKAEMPYAR